MKDLKQRIVDQLIEDLENKKLDKITVNQLASELDISRQTFYYYFDDLYAVIEWILIDAASSILDDYSDIDNWTAGYYAILNWMKKHEKFLLNIFTCVPREYIENFMYSVLKPYLLKVVYEEGEGTAVNDEQKDFIANFYTLAFDALTIDWIKNGMNTEVKEMIIRVDTITKGDIAKSIKKLENYGYDVYCNASYFRTWWRLEWQFDVCIL